MTWGSTKKIRKYREGFRVTDVIDLIAELRACRYVFVRGKAYHPAVLRNWSLASLECACRYGNARTAELTPAWIDAEGVKAMALAAHEEAAAIDHEFAEVGEAL